MTRQELLQGIEKQVGSENMALFERYNDEELEYIYRSMQRGYTIVKWLKWIIPAVVIIVIAVIVIKRKKR